jgi:hypothetical protein
MTLLAGGDLQILNRSPRMRTSSEHTEHTRPIISAR